MQKDDSSAPSTATKSQPDMSLVKRYMEEGGKPSLMRKWPPELRQERAAALRMLRRARSEGMRDGTW